MNAAITVRRATFADAPALRALAQLDGVEPLTEPALLAEREGKARAAISLADGTVAADPFHPTADLVELLRVHATQLAAQPTRGERVRHALQVLSPRSALRAAA